MLSLLKGPDPSHPSAAAYLRLPSIAEKDLGQLLSLGQLPDEGASRRRTAAGIAAGMAASAWLLAANDRLSGATLMMFCCCALLGSYWRALELGRLPARHRKRLIFAMLTLVIVLMSLAGLFYAALHQRPRVVMSAVVLHKKDEPGGPSRNNTLSYAGIILWPKVPRKKKLIVPPPMTLEKTIAKIRRPMVIPFDGAYWYFHAPAMGPRPKAHVAHGNPTHVDIYSNSTLPILMEAHQSLSLPVELSCCRELDLDLRNNDDVPGAIRIAVVLIDTSSSPAKSIDLGAQPVLSSEPPQFSLTRPAADEMLRYPIRARGSMHQFNEIEVVFLPSPERNLGGVRIAIRNFQLLPAY